MIPPAALVRPRGLCAMKTYVATSADRQRDWYVVDAEGQTLGRLATQIADTLRGKRKPEYTPHVDTGDFVVVVNAEKIHVTGKKLEQKRYWRHSGYPGGIKSRTPRRDARAPPEEVIRKAVKGMLPRNRLARRQLTKLKVYAGPDHPHAAQQPEPMEIELMADDQTERRDFRGRRVRGAAGSRRGHAASAGPVAEEESRPRRLRARPPPRRHPRKRRPRPQPRRPRRRGARAEAAVEQEHAAPEAARSAPRGREN